MRVTERIADELLSAVASLSVAQRESIVRSGAVCAQVGPDVFFAEDIAGIVAAREICATCPVRALCLDAAIGRAEPAGVWGGELFCEGQIVTQKRPRGRPRKDAPVIFVSARLSGETAA
jgi:WhiB family redox-sensing transcriptional regulator